MRRISHPRCTRSLALIHSTRNNFFPRTIHFIFSPYIKIRTAILSILAVLLQELILVKIRLLRRALYV